MSRVLIQAQQKLGQIDLSQYTGQEQPDAFVWAEIAANNFTESRKHVEDLETQLATQAEIIDKLQSQLDSIVNAKDKHEGVLLHKFTELINSKKVKIRGQQRLLGTAKVDPDAGKCFTPGCIPDVFNFDSRDSFPYPIQLFNLYPHTLTCYSGAHSTSHIEVPQSRGITFVQTQGQRSCGAFRR